MPVPFDLFSLSFRMSHYPTKNAFVFSPLNRSIHHCFAYLERTSKRSRIMDFFRGRGRPSERTENNDDARDQSHISFIDKTSMK